MIPITNFKRLCRSLLCLLVICCIIFNMAAVPAQAEVITMTAGLGIGLAACAILLAGGVVLHPETAEDVIAIGQNMQDFLDTQIGVTIVDQELLLDWYVHLGSLDFGDDPDDSNGFRNTQIKIARGLLAGVTAWIGAIALAGMSRPDVPLGGKLYYNDMLLPALPDLALTSSTFTDWVIWQWSDGRICLYSTYNKFSMVAGNLALSKNYRLSTGYKDGKWYDLYQYDLSDDGTEWVAVGRASYTALNFGTKYSNKLIWSLGNINFGSEDSMNRGLAYEGTVPSNEGPVMAPEIYAPEPDPVRLSVIEIGEILKSNTTAVADMKQTLNQVNVDTYQEYMEKLQPDPEPEPDTEPAPEPEPEPSPDSDGGILSGLNKLVDFFTGTVTIASPLEAIQFGTLFDLFPFSIPHDIYQTIKFWDTSQSAPVISIPFPMVEDGALSIVTYDADLSKIPGLDALFAIIRAGELILFAIGLLLITRKVTKW